MQPWLQEWNKFDESAIDEIKSHNDDSHLEREWMSYVYEKNGKYFIGRASKGEESKIEIIPAEKTAVDNELEKPNLKQGESIPIKYANLYSGFSTSSGKYSNA